MRFWAGFVIVGIVAEMVALVTRFPTLSQAWHHARATWPPPVSLGLSVVTFALGLWLLTVHWSWSVHDRPSWIDDIVVSSIGAVVGALAWRSWRRSHEDVPGGVRPGVDPDVGSVARSESAADVRDGEVPGH